MAPLPKPSMAGEDSCGGFVIISSGSRTSVITSEKSLWKEISSYVFPASMMTAAQDLPKHFFYSQTAHADEQYPHL